MNVEIPRYKDVLNWLNENKATSKEAAHKVSKIGSRSKHQFFLAWAEGDTIMLMPHPEAKTQKGYEIKKIEWNAFIAFRRDLSPKEKSLARTYANRFAEWKCSDRVYYPAIPAISWQYFSEADK